jgi:transmembrane sensor
MLNTQGTPTTFLAPGDDAVATSESVTVIRKTPQELANELAWRRGLLVFRQTKLADVVREFNRYNATKLVIADPSIADEKISADVKLNDFDSFLQLAELALNLRVERENGIILISRQQPGETKRAGRIKHGL